MNDFSSLSLEQDFILRVLSAQIQANTDVSNLQSDLIELFKITLIIQKDIKNLINQEVATKPELNDKLESRLSSYVNSITVIKNTDQLQELLIKAHKMLMIQENYAQTLCQNQLVSPWIEFKD